MVLPGTGYKKRKVLDLLDKAESDIDPVADSIVNSFFQVSASSSISISDADGIFENFRQVMTDDKENSAITPTSGEKSAIIKDKHHVFSDVKLALYVDYLRHLSVLNEEQIPNDFEQHLPSSSISRRRKMKKNVVIREWAGVGLKYPVDRSTSTLTIPHTT